MQGLKGSPEPRKKKSRNIAEGLLVGKKRRVIDVGRT